jgi:hypothetical protein
MKMADKPKPKEQHIHVHVHGAAKSDSKPKQAGLGGGKADAGVGKPPMDPAHEMRELQREHYIQGYLRGKMLRKKHLAMGFIPTRNGPIPRPVAGLGPAPRVSQGGVVEMPGHYAAGGDANPLLDRDDMVEAQKKASLWAKQTAFAAELPGATQPGAPGYAGGGLTPAQMHVLSRGAATDAGRARTASAPGAHLISSAVPGRVDRIPMRARTGSYVLPADVVSGLGQGNTMAGAKMWGEALSHGAGNIKTGRPSFPKVAPMGAPKFSIPKPAPMGGAPKLGAFAAGGPNDGTPDYGDDDDGYTPIITAGGELVIDPEVVIALGAGDPEAGKEMLNKSVLHVRKQVAAHNKELPGPVE